MPATESPLAGKDAVVGEVYARLLEVARGLGPVAEENKQTCVHLTAGEGATAFAGIHPRRAGILLTLRLAEAIGGPRVRKLEQASRNRFHADILVSSPDEVDAELAGWLRDAYALSRPKG